MEEAELGVLLVPLIAAEEHVFPSSTGRMLHAALLRRIELVDPELSIQLHDAPEKASSTQKPWTVSPLLSAVPGGAGVCEVRRDETCLVRISALTSVMISALRAAFDPRHPLGREPLFLDGLEFKVVSEQCRWHSLTRYASLLTASLPLPEIRLLFASPTGFRSQSSGSTKPEPLRSSEGYLRKWNAFSGLAMQEEALVEFVRGHLRMEANCLQYRRSNFGKFYQQGWIGTVTWKSDAQASFPLRMVNALANYAFFCGTGMKTTQGMGQTTRLM